MTNKQLKKSVSVRMLKEELNLEQVCGDEESLKREIIAPDINRPGLELTGYLESNELRRVVIIGNKESEYILKLDEETQRKRFEIITDSYTPCIIISHKNNLPILEEICNKKNVPVFRYEGQTYQISVDIVSYLSEKLAPNDCVYGVMMNIYGKGVMITGESGIGKSELALDLIKRGHMLVADDRVDVSKVHNDIICRAPKVLRRYLEVRGVGVVDVTKLFGIYSYLSSCELNFVIKLVKLSDTLDEDRLNPITKTKEILGVHVPMLIIPITEGKSLSVIVETAVSNYILQKTGINTNEEFKKNIIEQIKENGGNN